MTRIWFQSNCYMEPFILIQCDQSYYNCDNEYLLILSLNLDLQVFKYDSALPESSELLILLPRKYILVQTSLNFSNPCWLKKLKLPWSSMNSVTWYTKSWIYEVQSIVIFVSRKRWNHGWISLLKMETSFSEKNSALILLIML